MPRGCGSKSVDRPKTTPRRAATAASSATAPRRPRGDAPGVVHATPEQMLNELITCIGSEGQHDSPADIRHAALPVPEPSERDGARTLLELLVDGNRYVVRREPTAPRVIPPPARLEEPRTPSSGAHCLSPREHEIARMIAKGHPNKAIAMVLEISCWTVGTHVRRIFAKLGVGSRAAMIAKLMADGWSGEVEPHHLHPNLCAGSHPSSRVERRPPIGS